MFKEDKNDISFSFPIILLELKIMELSNSKKIITMMFNRYTTNISKWCELLPWF